MCVVLFALIIVEIHQILSRRVSEEKQLGWFSLSGSNLKVSTWVGPGFRKGGRAVGCLTQIQSYLIFVKYVLKPVGQNRSTYKQICSQGGKR